MWLLRLLMMMMPVDNHPTNIACAHLVMGCPDARAGVKIVIKKTPRATQILTPPSLIITSSGIAIGVALVIPILAGHPSTPLHPCTGKPLPSAKRPGQRRLKSTVPVRCYPLYTLLLAMGNPTVHFFSLDIEGAELPVLKTIPFDKV